ncbi:ganglioside-induced differentiation-associated protein 1-like [Saccoglossus kowalevskii]|uniref:Ganglioside-induced differentiation-associated protein 1-like n=1 Tax=Saccoglossus kowalevskii TaxID=10224 RepID=A0ABM0GPW5_SACKO|nr:PREDICTED: ganglioside-induced differentiation-associated protein 1-like [Saccoglossus kowalevskii]
MAGTPDILLYHEEVSYYSFRVRMALAIKDLKYKKRRVNLFLSENLEPWYMRLNPSGLVPILQHGETIVCDSDKILRYLDDAFPETIQLCPDESTNEGHMCDYFKRLSDKIDVHTITMIAPRFPEITKVKPRNPMFANAIHDQAPELCEKYANDFPDLAEAYLAKKKLKLEELLRLEDEELVETAIHACEDVMTKLEEELARNDADMMQDKVQWLCGERFTSADIYWAATLYRLEEMGYDDRYWANGKRPHIEAYYEQIRSYDCFRKSEPSRCLLLMAKMRPHLPWVLAVGGAAVAAGVIYALIKSRNGGKFPSIFAKEKIWVWTE